MFEKILDLIYPESIYCIACGDLTDSSRKYSLCDSCIRKFNWVTGRRCEKCGRPLKDDQRSRRCGICNEFELAFSKGHVCVEYNDDTKEIVHHYKFNDQPYIARFIADMMYDRLASEDLVIDTVTAVPMHKKRQKQRGYNQAELIAKALAKKMELPYTALLTRPIPTPAMSSLGIETRRLNLEGAFAPSEVCEPAGHRILLIDDVLTTGSTADACARVLIAEGAVDVSLAVFAAGVSLDRGS